MLAFEIVDTEYDSGYTYILNEDDATTALMLVSVPGAVLVGWAIRTMAALFRRSRLLIDDTGMRLLTRDPITECRWRAAAWWVPGLVLIVVSALFVRYWTASDDDGLMFLLPGAPGVLAVLFGLGKLLRIRRRRKHWLDRWRAAGTTDAASGVEIDAHRWPEVQAVAVQRVGPGRRRSVVTVPVDRSALTGPTTAYRRVMFNGTAFVFADLDAVGMPAKAVRAALERHSAGRFTNAIGH